MANGKKRMTIPGLAPGEDYVIQVRALDDGDHSVWSEKNNVLTIDDTAGGTRTPVSCTLSTFTLSGEGTYTATWPTVNANTDGTAMVVRCYQFRLVAGGIEKIAEHYGSEGTAQRRDWTLGQMKALWGGTLPTSITASIRVVNSAGTPSEVWSNEITVTMPVPYMPTSVVPPALAVVDGIKVMWGAPVEPFVAGDPRWPLGYRVYTGRNNPAFTPDVTTKANMIYQGPSLEMAHTTMSYTQDHYYKICSYSAADIQSDYISVGPYRPISPYGPDATPPAAPALDSATMNDDRSVSGQINLAWTLNAAVDPNKDLAGFVVKWKLTTDTLWRNTYFSKEARDGVVDVPRAFGNYNVKIVAYDFVGNYSGDSNSITVTGAGATPAALTGVDGIPRWDGMRLVWVHSASQGVIGGGKYEIQFKSTNSFPDNVPTHTTTNNFLDLAGLASLSTWWYRVRAVDVIGQAGPWSTVASKTLPAFPSGSNKDGVAPATAPQNPRTYGGVNYINVAWDRVANNDATNYEVYASTSSTGIDPTTPDPSKLVATTPATSLMINTIPDAPSGGLMLQNTTYYFRVRAIDLDGAGPLSAQTTGTLVPIAGGDLGINMSGENLLYNTSFEIDSDNNGTANYWEVFNGNTGTTPATALIVGTSGRTGGLAQRVTWTGNTNNINKGIRPTSGNVVVRPHTEYTLSFYARAGTNPYAGTSAGTGFGLVFATAPASGPTLLNTLMPVPDASVWNRYMFKFTTGATVDANNFAITVLGHSAVGGWVEFDDIQLEAGNIASAYKTGTVSIAKLASGTMETAIMTIAAGGQIKSADYVDVATGLGFLLNGTGLNLLKGTVNAATLATNTTITNKLFVGNTLEMASGGVIKSSNFSPPTVPLPNGAGYQISEQSIDIRSGFVGVGTLGAGTITSPDIKIGTNGKITVDSTGSIQSNNYNGPADVGTDAGWKISAAGIELWDANSKINVNALVTSTLESTTITMGSGGFLKSLGWKLNVAGDDYVHDVTVAFPIEMARWKLGEEGLEVYRGTITGSTIMTDQLYSITKHANGRYLFAINEDGYAELSGAYVYGNMQVGGSSANTIQSESWDDNSVGWQIRGDGVAKFYDVTTWGMTVRGSALVGNTPSDSLRSGNWSSNAAGWILTGQGVAEFNGGTVRVGGMDGLGGRIDLVNSGGNGQIRFHTPADLSHFHYIRSVGTEFWIMGGYGGHIKLTSDGTIYTAVNINNSNDIYSARYITAGNKLEAPTVTAQTELGGDPRFNWVGTTQNSHYAIFGTGGKLSRGAANSSRDFKNNIKPLVTVKTEDVLALEPKTFFYNEDHKEMGLGQQAGFIAEEAEELGLTPWLLYTGEKATGFNYPMFSVAQQVALRNHEDRIKELEALVKKLKKGS